MREERGEKGGGGRGGKRYHKYANGGLGDSNNLPTTSTTHRCSLYNTRKIEQLYLGVFMVDSPGNAREGGEFVRGNFAVDASQLAHERALAN